jgi:hypothetical protein
MPFARNRPRKKAHRQNLHAIQTWELVNKEQQPVPIPFLLRPIRGRPFRQPVHRHREHQPDEPAQTDLAGWRHDQVKRNRSFLIHQIVDDEIAGAGISSDERIAV